MRKIKQKKKAVAPLIATVLLISLAVILAAIIYFWVRGFISEQIEKFGQSAEESCKLISFDADLIKGETGSEFFLDLTNIGQIPINEFDIKKFSAGESNVERIEAGLGPGDSKSIQIGDLINTNTITVIPVLLGTVKGTSNRKSFKCTEELGIQLEVPEY